MEASLHHIPKIIIIMTVSTVSTFTEYLLDARAFARAKACKGLYMHNFFSLFPKNPITESLSGEKETKVQTALITCPGSLGRYVMEP